MKNRIILVDDDSSFLNFAKSFFEDHGFHVHIFTNGTTALQFLSDSQDEVALAVLDFRLPDLNGDKLAEKIRAVSPNTYLLFLSGDQSRDAIKSAWQVGAVGFIEKTTSPEDLLTCVKSWCHKHNETRSQVKDSAPSNSQQLIYDLCGLVGTSESLLRVALKVDRYKHFKENILILGETGTGKEKIAQALNSMQTGGPFLAVNCASFSSGSELLESELFGYMKGAFTGANADKKGLFELADGGTIFLDEVHTLSIVSQQKLLRAIQERRIRRIGSSKEISLNVRFISAARPDIEQLIAEGKFLPDLYERLNVLRIEISSLRERPEDIQPLAVHFCKRYSDETGITKVLLRKTVEHLASYSWPRNVRELENQIRRLCVDVESDIIEPKHLDAKFFGPAVTLTRFKATSPKERIIEALSTSTSQREAARKLGIPESSLRVLIKRLNIDKTDDLLLPKEYYL